MTQKDILRGKSRCGATLMRILRIPVLLGAALIALTAVIWHEMDPPSHNNAATSVPSALDPARWSPRALTIANLGHSTLLMDWFGLRVISDPVLFYRVGLSLGPLTIGPHRMVPLPLRPDHLQDVQVILITHAHMDHLDLPSLRALPKSATVVACSGCAGLIRPLGFTDIRELRWGDRVEVRGLRITAMGARHWGVRWPPLGRAYGYNSYLLERGGARMLLACDSAFTPMFAGLASAPLDIAAFSIAAYDPWIHHHANPEQVWEMFQQTGARYLIPIHWGTFRLSKERMDEPIPRLLAAAGPGANRVVLRRIGVPWTLPAESMRESQAASVKMSK
jgi:L-ascorbate metabolism protein UlaG (beta-lactamase superfamily)